MARYHFHFKIGDTLEADDDGQDLPDLSAAVREAELSARELLAHAIKDRKPELPEAVVIADDSGAELYSLPLAAVLPDRLKK